MMMMNTEEEEEELIPGCWSDLPFDLVAQIADKVIMSFSLSDYIRFGAVCYPWRSFLLQDYYYYEHIKLSHKLPVLLLPSLDSKNNIQPEEAAAADNQQQQQQQEGGFLTDAHDYYNPREIWLGLNHKQRHQNTRSTFYSILEKKVYDFQLPTPSYLNCRGSSHGWLVVVEECIDGAYPVHLLNPFRSDNNNNKIQLPPLNSSDPSDEVYQSYYLYKAILSADPSSLLLSNPTTTIADDELVVLGVCGVTHLKFCRPGDKEWTALPESIYSISMNSCIVDITCYRGQFWVIVQNGGAMAFDIYPLLPEPYGTTIIDPPQDDDDPYSMSRYLVESAGNLFQVRRDFIYLGYDDDKEESRYSTGGFHVFKLDRASMEWVKTNSLDGYMFFLGYNASISLSASDYYFSGGGGSCKPNSICFTNDYSIGYGSTPWSDGPHDMGVFNLDDGRFEHFEPYYTVDSRNIMPPRTYLDPTNAIKLIHF